MKKAIGKAIGIFILAIGGGIFGSQILWPYFVQKPLFLKYRLWENPPRIIEKKEITITQDNSFREVIPKVKNYLVEIEVDTPKGKIEWTGISLTSDGVFLTLSQNIPKNFSKIVIKGEDFSQPAKILKRSSDLTLLKVDKEGFFVPSFPQKDIFLGEKVFYLTKRKEEGLKNNLSLGIGFITKIYPHSFSLNIEGEKEEIGSPLFDLKGELLGIIYLDKQGKVQAISFNEIKKILP